MTLSPEDIRAARAASTLRVRELAAELGLAEAQLVAARTGRGVTRIAAHPDRLIPEASKLGEVMALTRNDSAVHERVGTFGDYRSGPHAAMVLGEEIDTRIFPRHWVHGFAVEEETGQGLRRSLQVFDAAGDAVQKIYLRDASRQEAWSGVVTALREAEQPEALAVDPRDPPEPAKMRPEARDALLAEWARMTDTHQFNRLASKFGMNRLGAYRLIAGTGWVRPMETGAVSAMLGAASATGQEVGLFVGNRGNIQIHWGPMQTIKPMGPWLNVLDPRFNLHLRGDHLAEVYRVEKPTKRGPAVSLEAFDAAGQLIFQVFGRRRDEADGNEAWHALVEALPAARTSEVPA
ncbi:hemin-degrading factor [Mangrovicoccus ximenensis]|uniref:hemin-degrading factor n=1 Tax=Mangrovicoccus ximenensis TaxID=1911570 RepID=UPI000D36DE93|nr:ChuX/HutX family heme-like substrate-binding protein [Mangrovicoccus ximenensis]